MFNETNVTLRDAQKAETRAHLLAVARDLLEARGYAQTSLRLVAREAGVSPATVVFHFGDKPGLLHAALFDELEDTLRGALAELPAEGPLLPWLRGLVARFFFFYAQRPALSRALLRHSLLAEGDWGARFKGQYEVLGVAVARRLRAAQLAGEVSPQVEPRRFVTAFFSFYLFQLIDAAGSDFRDLDARLDLLESLLAQQLAAPPPGGPHDDPLQER